MGSLGGFNGTSTGQKVDVPMGFLSDYAAGTLITDGEDRRSVEKRTVAASPSDTITVTLRGRGGVGGWFAPDQQ